MRRMHVQRTAGGNRAGKNVEMRRWALILRATLRGGVQFERWCDLESTSDVGKL